MNLGNLRLLTKTVETHGPSRHHASPGALEELSKEPKIQQGHRPILRIQWSHESNRAIVKKDGYK
jgi:hypothetical protein